MPRMARIVAPGSPHHVTQRGNRRQQTFFNDGDYLRYLQLAAEWCTKADVECWGYCLMPNHVHLILTPKTETGLRAALSPLHWRYTYEVNKRERWTGYLWQGRFASYPMDEDYFVQASRYVGAEPRARGPGCARRGLAVVERTCASGRPRRCAGQDRAFGGARARGLAALL
jgi:putative transposase